jgi:hypothetical protein
MCAPDGRDADNPLREVLRPRAERPLKLTLSADIRRAAGDASVTGAAQIAVLHSALELEGSLVNLLA